LSLMASSTP
jgi:hypothetical protein